MIYFNSRILFFLVFIPFILITINTENASPQTSKNNEEKSALYLKLSDLVKNTGDDIVQSMSAIESGDNMSGFKYPSKCYHKSTRDIKWIRYFGKLTNYLIQIISKDN